MDIKDKVKLIQTKIEILKLKADDYNWQCHTPNEVKKELDETLLEINKMLEATDVIG